MIRVGLFLTFCIFSCACWPQSAKQSIISPYLKAGAYSYQQADIFSFTTNQGALGQIKTFSAGVSEERKFMLQELNLFSAAVALPTPSGTFGLQFHHYGNSVYSEMQTGLAYGKKLNDYIDVGVQFNYYTMQAAGYGRASAVNFEAGAIFNFTDKLHGGVHAYNPTSSKIGKNNDERLPAVYNAGLGYDASENFFVSAEIEKAEDMPINVNAIIQYQFGDRFLVRGGVATNTSIYFLGIGFKLEKFRVDATASIHPQLGVTPGVLLIYTKEAKE